MKKIDQIFNTYKLLSNMFYVFVLCDYHQYHGVLVRWRCSCGDTFTCNCPILVLNKVYYYYYYYYIHTSVMEQYLKKFRFRYDFDSNCDTCKHSMFTGIKIGITIFSIVFPDYFPALGSLKTFHYEQGIKTTTQPFSLNVDK